MREASLVFPNQLFEINPCCVKDNLIFLIEDSLFFGDKEYPTSFHKKKLVLHRASMKYYEEFLKKEGFKVIYFDYPEILEEKTQMEVFFDLIKSNDIKELHFLDPVDWALERRILKNCNDNKINTIIYDNPGFLCNKEYINSFFKNKKKYLQTSFYIQQRKNFKILLKDGKPIGGKWTFDKENRKKLPKGIKIPIIPKVEVNKYIREAVKYVSTKFPENPGNLKDFNYPITHKTAIDWLDTFLNERFFSFGPYEDAIKSNKHILFHSVLSPILNIGLITPKKIIEKTMDYVEKSDIPLNSLEGFLRQIIGWREFMRAIYIREGVKQRISNYWQNKKKLPSSFYTGTTEIPPIDNLIKSVMQTGYLHHIERLMLLGNFMNLCEIDPNEVYQWFMEMFIDAYDWVMVPNVYGMSLNADGGLITTKPYISSSNYVLRMSDYQKGSWCDIWNGLYWRFIHKHQDKIKKNPRMSMMVKILNRMEKDKLNKHLAIANQFLKDLHENLTIS